MNNTSIISKYWGLIIAVAIIPFLLNAIIQILPTFDDWTSTTTPDFNPFFIKERFLFYGYHWRPFDAILGYIVGLNPQQLFPTFNHCCIVTGHLLCTILIFSLLSELGFSTLAKNISALYFFISPATMATVSAVDSLNQTFALVAGIAAFLIYIKGKYAIWAIMIFIAALFKENGLMWALICPILAYGFDKIELKTLKRDIVFGLMIMALYALAIFLLPKDIIIHPEYVPEVIKVIKNIVKFFFTTFITIDYIYLLHQPSRQLIVAFATFILTLPFIYYIFIRNIKYFINKKILCTTISLLIAVAPHLLTVFSMMHTYAGMALLAVIIAYSIDCSKSQYKQIVYSFILFCCSALMINTHLIKASIKSGLIGKNMAVEAISKTIDPVKSVYVIIIEDDYPKLSSFCVIPNEAFGWGLASQYETNYVWPEIVNDTIIERSLNATKEATDIGHDILNKNLYDCVWLVDRDHIDVIKK